MNGIKELTNRDKIVLCKNISLLQKQQHIEIYKIIKNDTNKFTENNNGIFVNLNNLKPETIEQIHQFVDFCLASKDTLTILEKQKQISMKYLSAENSTTNINACENVTDFLSNNIDKYMTPHTDTPISINNEVISLTKKRPLFSNIQSRIMKKCKDIDKCIYETTLPVTNTILIDKTTDDKTISSSLIPESYTY